MTFLGVDVGGRRKGFDAALIDDRRLLCLESRLRRDDVVELVAASTPTVVAIDGPRCCAPRGHTAREGERLLARAVCGIRWTPDIARVRAGDYYAWIVEGLALYEALADRDVTVIEVFPTAAWTRWHGPRGKQRRSAWSREAMKALPLTGLPANTNQDGRDAIAAAVTARQFEAGRTETFGEIVVPAAGAT